MSFTMIEVTGTYVAGDGSPLSGEVTFTPTVPMRNDSIVVAAPVTAVVTPSGTLSVSLAATDDPDTTPEGGTYKVVEKLYGLIQPRTYYLAVPYDGGPIDLDDPSTTIIETYPDPVIQPGPPGPEGPQGDVGPAGADGRTILSGSGAPGNGLGANGDFYIDTAADAIYGPKTAGAWGPGTPLTGPAGADGTDGTDGADGADGRTLLSGTGAPGSGLGADGDFYIDTAADAIYGPKTAGAWGAGTSLVGPPGAGSVDTVNGDPGPAVVLDAADVGADPAGTAAAAVAAHSADTTDVHGIPDTSVLATDAEVSAAVAAHAAASDPHGEYLTEAAAPELIRDTVAAALVAGSNVTITPNDGADTITIASTGGGGSADYVRASTYGWSPAAAAATNDTAIANAIAAARAGNRRLYVGSGDEDNFNISVPIDARAIVGDGETVEIFGDGRGVTSITQTTPTAEVLQYGGYNGYLHDLTLRHTEADFTATPTTLGAGLGLYKLAYGTIERVQLTANGYGIRLAPGDVFEPGTSSGAGNYSHSVRFSDVFILRYGVDGIEYNQPGAVSTGSTFRNCWIQNQATNGAVIQPSGRALDLFLCDEMIFTQLNIEDISNNMPVLLNSCGGIMFESLHFERANLRAGLPQYIRAAGGSQAVIDGMTVAFSDVAQTGATGSVRLLTAVTGGKIEARGVTVKNLTNTAALPLYLVGLDDADQGSSFNCSQPGGASLLTALTVTPVTNPGYLRAGNRLGPAAMPASYIVALTDGATVALDASLGKTHRLVAAGNRTILTPTGSPADGQPLIIVHTASGGARTLTLTTGSAGAFAFGTDVTGLTATPSGTTDYIGCIYDAPAARWRVVSYAKGYA